MQLHDRPLLMTMLVVMVGTVVLWIYVTATRAPALHNGTRITVKVDAAAVKARVAASPESQAKGLAGTTQLAEGEGMFFPLAERKIHSFWMKGVTFPIDIIWISGGTVTDINANVPPADPQMPDDKLPRYQSTSPSDRVLEVSAGWAAKHSVQAGDPVRLSR